jgi:hypothetical protein
MDLTYKIVSDYNLGTNFNRSESTKGLVVVDPDERFNSINAGSYDILISGSERHGVFSRAGSFELNYFIYTDVVSVEKVLSNETSVLALNPRFTINSIGNPFILYYDPTASIVKTAEKISGGWVFSNVDFVNMITPIKKRQISLLNNGADISATYIYNISDTTNGIKYASYDGAEWNVEDVFPAGITGILRSVSLLEDSSGRPNIVAGTTTGIFMFQKRGGTWVLLDFYEDDGDVSELDAVHDESLGLTHISYVSSTESRYQQFDHSDEEFLPLYKFIDFNSSSVSIGLKSDGEVIISYSHIEIASPLTIHLKIARSSSGVSSFQTFNIDKSQTGARAGEFSDIAIDDTDKMFVVYLNVGIFIYDEQKDIDENFIETTSWKDRKFVNNLAASANPPTRNVESTFMEFTASGSQYFFIGDSSQTDLDRSLTEFSISFSVIPKGEVASNQVIVSKGSLSDGGYQIFLGGTNGLTLGFFLSTVFESIQILVSDLPANELSKVAFVYSGYDVKIYVKSASSESFTVTKYDIFGSVETNDNPFVIGASSTKTTSDSNPYYGYEPVPVDGFDFSDFLDAKLINLKYWKRELDYKEASYDDAVSYHSSIDPYSDNLDYKTFRSSSGANHFFLNGNNLSVDDYGGVGKINLLSYSNLNAEERVTDAPDLSHSPYLFKSKTGGINLIWADKRDGKSEIYTNEIIGNNADSLYSRDTLSIKVSGKSLKVYRDSNIATDPTAKFLDNGVYVGDYINITSGDNYSGRRIPVVKVLNNSTIEIGAFVSKNESNLGYYIEGLEIDASNDVPVKLTSLSQNSSRPVGVSDSIGDSHVVWESLDGEFYEIYYKRYRPSLPKEQIWGSVKLTNKEGDATKPSMGIDKQHVLHLVWEDERNKDRSVMYARSGATLSDSRSPQFVSWSSSNFNGRDKILSGSLFSEDPKVIIDKNDTVHVCFVSRVDRSDDTVYEVYYVNNENGYFSSPVRVTNLLSRSKSPDMAMDDFDNIYIVFPSNEESVDDLFLLKYDSSDREWRSPKKIHSSEKESTDPSISIDPDGKIYIFWIEKDGDSHAIIFSEYDSEIDDFKIRNQRNVSSAPGLSLSVNNVIDDTKTVYITWEDVRDFVGEEEEGSEVFRNQLSNLIVCEKIKEEEGSEGTEDKTDEEIVQSQLSRFVIGKTFPDVVTSSQLPLSIESLREVILTFETNTVSFIVPIDLFNKKDQLQTLPDTVMDFRDIKIKIKGPPNTFAYRIKNTDDINANFSEFYEYTIDEQPDVTIASHRLSSGNGQKQVCIQFYTIEGLTSSVCHDLFLNETTLFNISLFNDEGNVIGESVETEYQNTKALTSKAYWVKIQPLRLVDDTQKITFDVILQGDDILGVETELSDGVFLGKFTIQPHDGIRYIDGDAKIVPKIVDK